ncbi:hypothetical protein [Mycolicibacterium holsaticum]|uniref:hypothetical protein n=1 Tax=Mycolicibacterium holsaticum TaxID=152142 RepID=UPI00223DBCCA|nr:hypothetical protein [Mycolicibacterium holsaticum]MDA4107414.1 hypothetical protein [Mycolicibacterium holsaticum DSM 44478 = JCM 12374]UNC11315.1 hypothetical protein H5U41_08460 [Mycolicibacterium holsaticum DSM 44478 = JCM 12374]
MSFHLKAYAVAIALTVTGCFNAQDAIESGVDQAIDDAKGSQSSAAPTTTAAPNSSSYFSTVSLPSYLTKKGWEDDVEVWGATVDISDASAHWAQLKSDMAHLFKPGQPRRDWRWCPSSTESEFRWQIPQDGSVTYIQMLQSYQYTYVKFGNDSTDPEC